MPASKCRWLDLSDSALHRRKLTVRMQLRYLLRKI
jgi:hypothetical protein